VQQLMSVKAAFWDDSLQVRMRRRNAVRHSREPSTRIFCISNILDANSVLGDYERVYESAQVPSVCCPFDPFVVSAQQTSSNLNLRASRHHMKAVLCFYVRAGQPGFESSASRFTLGELGRRFVCRVMVNAM
jgi:hypothetical protein